MIKLISDFLSNSFCKELITYYEKNEHIVDESVKFFEVENYGTKVKIEGELGDKIEELSKPAAASYLAPYDMDCKFEYKASLINCIENSATPPHYDKQLIRKDDHFSIRPFVFLVYLNDDFEGGDLLFPAQAKLISPKTGTAIIFPANFYYPHSTLPTRGVRYGLRISYRNTGGSIFNSIGT